jgi:hypothetical protein
MESRGTAGVDVKVMLLLPLSVSFARLVQQTHLESSLRAALLTRTITFQSLELVSFDTDC